MKVLEKYLPLFESMNLAELKRVWPDDLIISNTQKEFILLKIEDIFKVFQQYNNDKLIIKHYFEYNRQEGRVFVYFVAIGNISSHFVFCPLEIKSKNKFLHLDDLFISQTKFFNLKLDIYKYIEIVFFKDETIGFLPNKKYFSEREKYIRSVEDLLILSEYEMTINDIEIWLDDYSELYELLSPYRLQFRHCFLFYTYYNTLLEFKELNELESAIEESLLMIPDNELTNFDLNKWIDDNRWLFMEIKNLNKYKYIQVMENGKIKIAALLELYYNNKDLAKALRFLDVYSKAQLLFGEVAEEE